MDSLRILKYEVAPNLSGEVLSRRNMNGSPKLFSAALRSPLELLTKTLRSNDLEEAMRAGCVTFGMVKPEVTVWGNQELQHLEEDVAVYHIMHAVKERLEIVVAHNMIWDRDVFTRFRDSNRETMRAHSSELGFESAWEEEVALMTEKPVTPMLLEGDEAMKIWREMIGHANPTKADNHTIRGRYASRRCNNLVHGASAADYGCPVRTLKHEIGCWADNVEAMIRQS